MKKFFVVLFAVLLFQMQSFALRIPQGTLVMVKTSKVIDADEVKIGDSVKFKTVKPVKVDGNVVIKQDTEVNAIVINKKNNGVLGIPGKIEIGDFYILTNDNEAIHLTGTVLNEGQDRYWANVGWLFFITLPMLFIKGNDGKILPNANYMLYTAEDVDI